jgi:hypothetical protein
MLLQVFNTPLAEQVSSWLVPPWVMQSALRQQQQQQD